MNFLLKLLGLLFVAILSIFGFTGFLVWLALKNQMIRDLLLDGAAAVAKEVLFPDDRITPKKYDTPLKPTK